MTPADRTAWRQTFQTTAVPAIVAALAKLAEAQHRTKSEILTDALHAYARRFQELL